MSEGFQIAPPHKDAHVNHVKFVAKARVGEVCSDRNKLLDEVKKRVALTEDEAEILAHDNKLWFAPKNEDCENVNQHMIGAPRHWLLCHAC